MNSPVNCAPPAVIFTIKPPAPQGGLAQAERDARGRMAESNSSNLKCRTVSSARTLEGILRVDETYPRKS